jgi:hypothetical protein
VGSKPNSGRASASSARARGGAAVRDVGAGDISSRRLALGGLVDAVADKEVRCGPRPEPQCPPAAVREHKQAEAEEDEAPDKACAPEETAAAVLPRPEQEFSKRDRGGGVFSFVACIGVPLVTCAAGQVPAVGVPARHPRA